MSKDETMTTSSTGALKAENDERYDLIPAEPLRLLARHYGVGSKKYEARNWEKGIEWHKNFAAAQRHLWQFWHGEDMDSETGTPHVISAAWHCFALAEYMTTHKALDDRPSTIAKRNPGAIRINPPIPIPNITVTPGFHPGVLMNDPYAVANEQIRRAKLQEPQL